MADPDPVKLEFDAKLVNLFQMKGFTLERLLSRGAFGEVYLGTNLKNNQAVAIKVMFLQALAPICKQKFLAREIDILKQISLANHPNIVYIHSIMLASKKFFIFMEFAAGGDMARHLKKSGPLSEPQAAHWIGQIASALHFLHLNQRIAHRDIKLDNLLLFGEQLEVAKLSDFGFAIEAWDWNRQQPILVHTWLGTKPYYSPQILLYQPYNAYATDCFALGVVLFCMLNNCFPYHHASSKLQLREQTDRGYLRTRFTRQFSADLLHLLDGLLAVEESTRFTIEHVVEHVWIKRGGS